MAFKLVISDKVRFRVQGSLADDQGKAQPFAFWLTAERVGAEALRAMANDPALTVAQALADKVLGWADVQDADGAAQPYTREAFEQMLDMVGMAPIVLAAYVDACGAKAKN